MDVTALVVFVSGFVVCAGVVFLISTFGAKEETYEEALAKQRKANEKEKKSSKEKKKENENKKSKNWRMKKKGERDDKNDGLEEEEEQVVLVEAGAKIEDVVEEQIVVEEKAPEPVAEVKPLTRKEKKNKNKIEIKEVESEPAVNDVVDSVPEVEVKEAAPVVEEAPAPVETVKPVKASPAKQKNKKEKTPEVAAAPVQPVNPKELLTLVKKTAFNDAEAQKLIDVLLTKQSGDALNTSDEWIEKGKPSETQKLKQELSETIHSLEDERMKVKSFTDKLTAMRKELNEEKSARANHNRVIDEIRKSAGQEVTALNNRLQQVMADNNLLQNNLQSEVAMRRNIELGQSHYQASIDNLNSQLNAAKMAAAQAKANDPHLLTELEQLRTLRDKYEKTLAEINVNNSSLQNQISEKNEEISNIKNQLSSSSDKVSQLSNSNSSLEKALAAKTEEANKASTELKTLKSKPQGAAIINNNNINIAEVEAELANVKQKLVEKETETKRLVEENERLSEQVASALERPAAEGEEAGAMVNGHTETKSDSKEVEDWKLKFEQLNLDHEKMLAKQKVIQSDFEAEMTNFKGQVETLKTKNNDLSSSLAAEKTKSCSELLHRLFPALSTSSDLDHLESEARTVLETLGRGESQVAHYKSVLAQTEAMLTSLQTSVESEETKWRLKLDAANKEISELKAQTSYINNSQQMQEQVSQLKEKLAKEEEDKTKMSELSDQLDKEVERLSQELSDSRIKQDELTKQVSELQVTNTSLKDLVSNTQTALSKEQNLVKHFQEQVSNSKVENGQSSPEAPLSVTNNLSIPPSISTPSLSPSVASIDSTTNTSPEKKKKSKKKKILGIFKSSS